MTLTVLSILAGLMSLTGCATQAALEDETFQRKNDGWAQSSKILDLGEKVNSLENDLKRQQEDFEAYLQRKDPDAAEHRATVKKDLEDGGFW